MSEDRRSTQRRTDHWPYAADHARRALDRQQIEQHAIRILARGMRSQRLVAFVGAGLSMAYGRLTWRDWLARMFDQVPRAGGKGFARHVNEEASGSVLWKNKADFLDMQDHPVKAQILAEAWDRDPPLATLPDRSKRPRSFRDTAMAQLRDHQGYLEELGKLLGSRRSPSSHHAASTGCDGLRGVIELLAQYQEPPGDDGLVQQIDDLLSRSRRNTSSPLRQLIVDWRIRRFITTNYDNEIERALQVFGFREVPPAERRGQAPVRGTRPTDPVMPPTYRRFNFDRQRTGDAITFATDGGRRHAEVMHLHGSADASESAIITESDYQNLYLADHAARDLVNNASQANFAANPMVFVGSDVSEDDVLRPVRQFMTGPGHRSDRLAVAVFAGTRPAHERAQQAARLLVKYRVHAVHAVAATVQPSGSAPPVARPDWLSDAAETVKKLKAMIMCRDRSEADQLWKKWRQDWHLLPVHEPLVEIEGLALQPPHQHLRPFDFNALPIVSIVNEAIERQGPPSQWSDQDALWHCYVLDQWLNHVISIFVCCKLIRLREAAEGLNEEETKLPNTFHKALLPRSLQRGPDGFAFDSRHHVCLAPYTFPGRFAKENAGGSSEASLDDGIADLCNAIRSWESNRRQLQPQATTVPCHAPSVPPSDRRLIIVVAERGAGKGAQFDRLSNGSPALGSLLDALGRRQETLVLHFNLAFSDDVTAVVQHLVDAIGNFVTLSDTAPQPLGDTNDLLESLDRALVRLRFGRPGHRVLLILGNAGVLFDHEGRAKNGLVHRVVRTLRARPFAEVPLDILMYVGESQIPQILRLSTPVTASSLEDDPDELTHSRDTYNGCDHRWQRRMRQLNIQTEFALERGVLVHGLQPTPTEKLAEHCFPEVYRRLLVSQAGEPRPLELLQALSVETGGSRFAQTLVLACLDDRKSSEHETVTALKSLVNRLHGLASNAAVEATVEVVLDRWAERFMTGDKSIEGLLPRDLAAERADHPAQLRFHRSWERFKAALVRLDAEGLHHFWRLSEQLLWHLAVFSHPVELATLERCPSIAAALADFQASLGQPAARPMLLAICAELLCHWCLVFRVDGCSLSSSLQPKVDSSNEFRYRYTVHRTVQRHFLKLIGGRSVETTFWDQFTTTLYASQPDEMPALRSDAHATLTRIVHTLTGYPDDGIPEAPAGTPGWRRMLHAADRIRAAYFLVRSTYSMGVVLRLERRNITEAHTLGHLERHRRMVRWITLAAQYWASEFSATIDEDWTREGSKEPMGLFYPGELVWLYNECGVISLAQGKMHDAEQMIALAELAVRHLETDDTGALHKRIRLHVGLVHIERGRPHLARRVLEPITRRRHDDDPLPAQIATLYLGLLAHVGGDYQQAQQLYARTLPELQAQRRSRAAAIVLMHQADLILRQSNRTEPAAAFAKAEEAISLAQQGGHEDVRHIAQLALVRLRIQARETRDAQLFATLTAAEQYAAEMDMPRISCEVHELRARLLSSQGEYVLSAAEATRSLEIAALYDLKLLKARAMLTLAKIYHRRGDLAGASALVRSGKEIATSADYFTCVRGFTHLETRLTNTSPAVAPHRDAP